MHVLLLSFTFDGKQRMDTEVLGKIADMGFADAKGSTLTSFDSQKLSKMFQFLLSKYEQSFGFDDSSSLAVQQKKIARHVPHECFSGY